ncbi:juvenile hormone acid O-methyltransferase-like [Zophobas morio]|uniref:juvenile hormone acid O-methyltransferase-like n=1 Tax=Zophobas morio TaxID=2755281 RepID=UPI003083967D
MAGFDAHIYSNNNDIQKSDATDILNSCLSFTEWSPNETIMDVGTGDGTVLFDVLLPKIPPNFKKIVALDINPDMLFIAESKCRQNEKIEFVCLDIATKNLPSRFQSDFDHIFSFYCLHWVADQRRAFENVYSMLKPGGSLLVTLVVDHVVCDVYDKLVENKKYSSMISSFKHNIFPYRNCKNSVETVTQLLNTVGFVGVKIEESKRVSVHKSFAEFQKWALGINPFMKTIPQEDLELYKEEFHAELKNVVKATNIMGMGEKFFDSYPVLVVFASKPLPNHQIK